MKTFLVWMCLFLLVALVGSHIYYRYEAGAYEAEYIELVSANAELTESVAGYETMIVHLHENLSNKVVKIAELRERIEKAKEKVVEKHTIVTKRDTIIVKGEAEIRYVDEVRTYWIDGMVQGIRVNGFLRGGCGQYKLDLIIPPVTLDIYLTQTKQGPEKGYIKSDAEFLKIASWNIHGTVRPKPPSWFRPMLGCGYGKKDGPGFMAGGVLWDRYVPMVTLETGGPSVYVGYIF